VNGLFAKDLYDIAFEEELIRAARGERSKKYIKPGRGKKKKRRDKIQKNSRKKNRR